MAGENKELNENVQENTEPKKISKVRLSGTDYELYSKYASAIDPNAGTVVSSVPDISTLSGADLSGKLFNGSALNDVVSALQALIVASQTAPILTGDIFTTTSVGYIEKGKTITKGTKLEEIWTSALSQYVEPSVSVFIKPSTTLYAYPETATITGITGTITNGTKTVTSYAIYEATNTATTSIAGFETEANVTSAVNITANAAKTFYVSASDDKETVTGSTSISFCWPYFHGVSETDTPTLAGKDVAAKGSKTYSYEPVGYYYIAYDAAYADLTSIKDNGGNGDETIGNWVKKTTAYEGHNYKMYITKESKAAAGTFKFV